MEWFWYLIIFVVILVIGLGLWGLGFIGGETEVKLNDNQLKGVLWKIGSKKYLVLKGIDVQGNVSIIEQVRDDGSNNAVTQFKLPEAEEGKTTLPVGGKIKEQTTYNSAATSGNKMIFGSTSAGDSIHDKIYFIKLRDNNKDVFYGYKLKNKATPAGNTIDETILQKIAGKVVMEIDDALWFTAAPKDDMYIPFKSVEGEGAETNLEKAQMLKEDYEKLK